MWFWFLIDVARAVFVGLCVLAALGNFRTGKLILACAFVMFAGCRTLPDSRKGQEIPLVEVSPDSLNHDVWYVEASRVAAIVDSVKHATLDSVRVANLPPKQRHYQRGGLIH